MYKTNEDFRWYKKGDIVPENELPSQDILDSWVKRGHVSQVEDSEPKPKQKSKSNQNVDLDFNDDGKVDAEDYSLAGKALAHSRKTNKKKSKKKKGKR